MTSSHKATEDPDETQASDGSQFDQLLASERPCVCMCVWRARLEGGVFECMTAGEIRREIVPVLEVILRGRSAWMCAGKRAYSRFYDCLLWLCLSGPCFCPADHISGAKRLFCAGMRKLRLDDQVIPSWIVHPIRYDSNYCLHVTPEMLER